jgi:RND superfamily putative drug exporter
MSPTDGVARWLAALGGFCGRHARLVVVAWCAAVALASLGAQRLSPLLFSGSGDIPGSMSLHVDELLREDFANPQSQLLVLALRSPGLDQNPAELRTLLDALKARWQKDQVVDTVTSEHDVSDQRLRPTPGTGHVMLISLKAKNLRDAEQAIPRLRHTADTLIGVVKTRHSDLEWAITGRAALTYDLNRFNAEDTTRAEVRALPLTALILVLAFGSLTAAGVPLLLGLASSTLTLGLVFLVARSVAISDLVQNVSSMVGLALGIDYSLFVIYRYRQEMGALQAALPVPSRAALQHIAIGRALEKAGPVVLYSGLTVLIGMGGLLATPLMETRSIGLGGCVVVAMAVLLALTLLPAILASLGTGLLEWPMALSRRLRRSDRPERWTKWANLVTRHPVAGAILSLGVLLALAWPGLKTRFGFPEAQFLPAELEYTRGMELLLGMDLKGLLSPLSLVLTDAGGGKALTTERVPALLDFSARLRHDPRIARVLGPVDLAEGWPEPLYLALYADVDQALAVAPQLRSEFLSTDLRRMLMQVIPSRDCTLAQTQALARAIPAWMDIPGLQIEVGGQPQYYNDFDVAVRASYVRSAGFVLVATAIVLMLVFRSPLVAVKALLLNALSVLAGYGVVVHVFQLGHGSSWLGVAAATEVVSLTIPLLIFCILFGLSMDYEIFLLSRTRAAFARTADTTASVREALADTGTVITSAALIMVAVFGAFAFARVVLVQMLGLGLAVAVLVDATLIRSLLSPAAMQLAGRWNWWPSRPIVRPTH